MSRPDTQEGSVPGAPQQAESPHRALRPQAPVLMREPQLGDAPHPGSRTLVAEPVLVLPETDRTALRTALQTGSVPPPAAPEAHSAVQPVSPPAGERSDLGAPPEGIPLAFRPDAPGDIAAEQALKPDTSLPGRDRTTRAPADRVINAAPGSVAVPLQFGTDPAPEELSTQEQDLQEERISQAPAGGAVFARADHGTDPAPGDRETGTAQPDRTTRGAPQEAGEIQEPEIVFLGQDQETLREEKPAGDQVVRAQTDPNHPERTPQEPKEPAASRDAQQQGTRAQEEPDQPPRPENTGNGARDGNDRPPAEPGEAGRNDPEHPDNRRGNTPERRSGGSRVFAFLTSERAIGRLGEGVEINKEVIDKIAAKLGVSTKIVTFTLHYAADEGVIERSAENVFTGKQPSRESQGEISDVTRITRDLVTRINAGKEGGERGLREGEQLSPLDLATEYGVSPKTMQTVLSGLSFWGVLAAQRGIGTYVGRTLPESVAKSVIPAEMRDAVEARVREKIADGTYPPQHYVDPRELAAELDCSLATVQSALSRMPEIRRRGGLGSFVGSIPPNAERRRGGGRPRIGGQEKVVRHILNGVADGTLAPGVTLDKRALAHRLGVSSWAVEDGLRDPALREVLKKKPGVGTSIMTDEERERRAREPKRKE